MRALALLPLLALAACADDGPPAPDTSRTGGSGDVALTVERVAAGLTGAVHVAAPPGDDRLFVVEQAGRIRIVRGGQVVPTPFLDIAARVLEAGEQGLLSMAFDPQFASNRRFYVYYVDRAGDIVVERYTHSPTLVDRAEPTGTAVITIPHPTHDNHNGGLAAFGPDGMLYLATGDGGSGGDPANNAQNLGTLLGKLLRLDVRELPYTVPRDNPYVGRTDARAEIWAAGLRNPFRFDFDEAGRLYIGDVGQDRWEEVNVTSASAPALNYGWRIVEGRSCYPSGDSCAGPAVLTFPVHTYGRDQGCAVTGGHAYRGEAIPAVRGEFFFSDYCGGWLRSLALVGGDAWAVHEWDMPDVGNVRSFGEDGRGELYLATTTGVWRVVRR